MLQTNSWWSRYTMSATLGGVDVLTIMFLDAGTPLLNALQDFS